MKVVIDTNCLLSCIGKRSSFRNVFDALLENNFTLCVSNAYISANADFLISNDSAIIRLKKILSLL